MDLFSDSVEVGTTPTAVFSFVPVILHSVVIEADCSRRINLGVGGVSDGAGLELTDGATLSFGYTDFDLHDSDACRMITIYAVGADAGDKVRIFGWRR